MLFPLIETIADAFNRDGIDYMVIGGQAVLVYGEPRLTKDIDITLGVGPEALGKILTIVDRIGLRPLPSDIEDFVREKMVLPLKESKSGLRIDLIFSFSTYEKEAIKRARSTKVGKVMVRFVSPEDLIVHKIIAGRPRDIEDVKGVMLKQPGLDRAQVRHWLKEFDRALAADYLVTFTKLEESLK